MRTITYSSLFENAFHDVVECGKGLYSQQTIKALIGNIRKNKQLLLTFPEMGATEDSINVNNVVFRHIVIPPYFKLIYFVEADNIVFTDLWDTRKNPEELTRNINKM